jgi:hypothetical protein
MTTATLDSAWNTVEGHRVLREYDTKQSMMDDIWKAHEHGWLPISMTESRRRGQGPRFLRWIRSENVVYTVAYYRTLPL